MPEETPPATEFQVDGTHYTLDDLTFAELREHRKMVRELSGDETAEVFGAAAIDYWPPFIYLIRKRSDPEYTLEQALDEKLPTFFVEKKPRKRPTRAAATT